MHEQQDDIRQIIAEDVLLGKYDNSNLQELDKFMSEVLAKLSNFSKHGKINNFSKKISNYKAKQSRKGALPPNGTLCRFNFKGENYNGIIKDGVFQVESYGSYNSFSSASGAVKGANKSTSGWRDWELKLPTSSEWVLADDWWRNNRTN